MSSINTTFQPLTDTIVVDNTAAVNIPGASQKGVSTFRIVALGAAGVGAAGTAVWVAWGRTGVTAPTAPAAVGTVPSNHAGGVICVVSGAPAVYVELPADSFFITNAAFATSSAAITGGQGGCGG